MSKEKIKINPSKKFIQNLHILYTVNEDFQADINLIIKTSSFIVFRFIDKKDKKELPKKTLNKEKSDVIIKKACEMNQTLETTISKLRKKYDLSLSYQNYLSDIIRDSIEFKEECFSITRLYPQEYLPPQLTPLWIKNPSNPSEMMTVLPITPEISLDDVQKYWEKIKNHYSTQEKRLQKEYTKINIDRDLEIFKLKKTGKSSADIAKIINSKYLTFFTYQEVNIIIKRLKDKAKKIIRQAS